MAVPIHDGSPTRRIPWMTYALIVVNVVVFLFLEPPSLQGSDEAVTDSATSVEQQELNEFAYEWGAIPCEIQHLEPLSEGITCTGERDPAEPRVDDKVVLLSLLTCMFVHGSLLHLAGNMLFLWVFGANVEDRLGPVPYLLLYLLTGLAATFGHALFHWDDAVPVIGASGAIAGVMGAYLVFRPRGRILTVLLWYVVHVPAWVLLGLFFVTQFLTPSEDSVAWMAHAAGMVAGFLAALVLARVFPDPWARPELRPRAASRA